MRFSHQLKWPKLLVIAVICSFMLGGASEITCKNLLMAEITIKLADSSTAKLIERMRKSQYFNSCVISPERLYAKVWEIIKDDYYDQSFNGQNWNYWQKRYIGKLKTASDAHKAIETMLLSLSDRYTRFLDRDAFDDEKAQIAAQLFGIGIQIGLDNNQNIIVIAPLDDTPASKAGLLSGDEIAEINGKTTKGFSIEEAAKQIKGPKDSEVILTIVRGAERLSKTIKRAEIHISAIQTAKMLDADVAYIRLNSFISEQATEEMKRALAKLSSAKGLVLDLRDNPGGLLNNAIGISKMFLDNGVVVVSTVDKDGYKTQSLCDATSICRLPLALLINQGSASASEIMSGAFKDNSRAVLVGQKTFGKGLVQGITKLEDGTGINVTIARYLTPNNHDINLKGITPDVLIELSDKDYKDGKGPWWTDPNGPKSKRCPEDMKDLQLNRAYACLKQVLETAIIAKKREPADLKRN